MSIDYGGKRTGLAVTDPLQIIATSLETVPTQSLMTYLKNYLANEEVNAFVVGEPKHLNNIPSEIETEIIEFIHKLKQSFPGKMIYRIDERFTSKIAVQTMVMDGTKKKERRLKGNIDKISATLILQTYLDQIKK